MLKPTRDAPEVTRALATASVASPLELQPGDVLAGKYRLVRPLGAGGMGQVWLARNLSTHADVAAKVLLPERVAVGDALERFRREAQATASLWHRGIVRAFDLVELDPERGSLLLVMELLHGQTLAQRLEQAVRLTVAETVRVLVPILSALDHAHRVGLVHRDLKPDNVFLAEDPDGEVIPKLVDFGISKMRHASTVITARGALVGTPFYMSPEQARGDAVDARSDVFAIGILLHECIAGAPPFGGQTLSEVVRAVLESEPAPLSDAPPALQAVIARALAKRPEDRYASAADLADAIVAAVPDAPSPPRSAPAPSARPGPPSMTSVPPAVAHTTIAPPLAKPRRSRVTWVVALGGALAAIATLRSTTDRGPTVTVHQPLSDHPPHVAKRIATERDTLATEAPTAPEVHHARSAPGALAPSRPIPVAAGSSPVESAAPSPAPTGTIVRDPGF